MYVRRGWFDTVHHGRYVPASHSVERPGRRLLGMRISLNIRQSIQGLLFFLLLVPTARWGFAQTILTVGRPGQIDIREAGEHSLRITLRPIDFATDFPATPALAERAISAPVISLRELDAVVREQVGHLLVEVHPNPLSIRVSGESGRTIQEITFNTDGSMSFLLDDQPVLGMGEGGPLPEPDTEWRNSGVEFDRRGRVDFNKHVLSVALPASAPFLQYSHSEPPL